MGSMDKEVGLMKKLITIAGASALLVTLSGCAGSFDTFQKAYDTCLTPTGITVSDGGKTLIINGQGEDSYGATIYDTACVLSAVGTPTYILSNMETTNSLMGRQSDTFDGIDVSWSYHPDNGLDVVLNKK
jgi:hypothetical protein